MDRVAYIYVPTLSWFYEWLCERSCHSTQGTRIYWNFNSRLFHHICFSVSFFFEKLNIYSFKCVLRRGYQIDYQIRITAILKITSFKKNVFLIRWVNGKKCAISSKAFVNMEWNVSLHKLSHFSKANFKSIPFVFAACINVFMNVCMDSLSKVSASIYFFSQTNNFATRTYLLEYSRINILSSYFPLCRRKEEKSGFSVELVTQVVIQTSDLLNRNSSFTEAWYCDADGKHSSLLPSWI